MGKNARFKKLHYVLQAQWTLPLVQSGNFRATAVNTYGIDGHDAINMNANGTAQRIFFSRRFELIRIQSDHNYGKPEGKCTISINVSPEGLRPQLHLWSLNGVCWLFVDLELTSWGVHLLLGERVYWTSYILDGEPIKALCTRHCWPQCIRRRQRSHATAK